MPAKEPTRRDMDLRQVAPATPARITLSQPERDQIIDLLWDHLKPDPEYPARRQTAWGSKTQLGLIACIERIANDDFPEDISNAV